MINQLLRKALLIAMSYFLLTSININANEIKLPDMGSPADTILSLNKEAQLGYAMMRDIRKSGQVVEDPIVTEYINQIGNKSSFEKI